MGFLGFGDLNRSSNTAVPFFKNGWKKLVLFEFRSLLITYLSSVRIDRPNIILCSYLRGSSKRGFPPGHVRYDRRSDSSLFVRRC
jgi:hypothetical protein